MISRLHGHRSAGSSVLRAILSSTSVTEQVPRVHRVVPSTQLSYATLQHGQRQAALRSDHCCAEESIFVRNWPLKIQRIQDVSFEGPASSIFGNCSRLVPSKNTLRKDHSTRQYSSDSNTADGDNIEDLARSLLLQRKGGGVGRQDTGTAAARTASDDLQLKPHFFGTGGFVAALRNASVDDRSNSHAKRSETFDDAATVIRHYGGNRGSPTSLRLISDQLISSSARIEEEQVLIPPEIMMVTASTAHKVRLTPAELCYSILINRILPLERGTELNDANIEDTIKLAGLTIQALTRESKAGKTFRLGGEGDALISAAGGSGRNQRDPLRNAKLADEVLRRLITARFVSDDKRNEDVSNMQRSITKVYNMALSAWAVAASSTTGAGKNISNEAALRAERLLLDAADTRSEKDGGDEWLGTRMASESEGDGSKLLMEYVRPDSVSFNTVLSAWSKTGRVERSDNAKRKQKRSDAVSAAERAEAILRLMIELSNEDFSPIEPTALSYESTIRAWAKVSEPNAADRVIKLLQEMETQHCEPSARHYTAIMKTFAKSNAPDASRRADELLARIPGDRCNIFVCNSFIGVHSKAGNRPWNDRYNSCLRIDQIIQDMQTADGHFTKPIMPDRISFGTAMMAWSMCARDASDTIPLQKVQHCSENARKHLDHLIDLHRGIDIPSSRISIHNINDVLRAYGAARNPRAAEELFELTKSNRPITPPPNQTSYALLVQAHAACSEKEAFASEMAEYWLRQLENNIPEKRRKYDLQDTATYNAVIDSAIQQNHTQRAERILEELIKRYEIAFEEANASGSDTIHAPRPNTHSFVAMISAYLRLAARDKSNVGLYARKCEALIETMESWHNISRQHLSSSSLLRKELARVTPNSSVYNTLLAVYAKADTSQEFIAKSEAVFERMAMMYSNEINESCAPDEFTLANCINICIRSGEEGEKGAGTKAMQLLEKVRAISGNTVRIDNVVYNTILKALISDGDLNKAEDFFLKSIPTPDIVAYSTLISAFGRKNARADRALELFEELLDSSNNTKPRPDAALVRDLLLAQLQSENAPSRIQSILERIASIPDHKDLLQTRHYNIVLQACAGAKPGCEDALSIALDIFDIINKSDSMSADEGTYSNMIRAVATHMPDNDKRKIPLLVGIFKKAAADGCVSYWVYDPFRRALPYPVYSKVLKPASKDGSISFKNVPEKWRRRL